MNHICTVEEHMLTVIEVRRPFTGSASSTNAQPSAYQPIRSWGSRTATPSPHRRHAPLAAVTADKAAVMRSTGRLTYSAGWSSKKAITFDAAI